MKLQRFLNYFGRISVADFETLEINFQIEGETPLPVRLIRFDAQTSTWTVVLAAPSPPAEEAQ